MTQVSPDDSCLKLTVIDFNFVDCFEKNPKILSYILPLVSPNRKRERHQLFECSYSKSEEIINLTFQTLQETLINNTDRQTVCSFFPLAPKH